MRIAGLPQRNLSIAQIAHGSKHTDRDRLFELFQDYKEVVLMARDPLYNSYPEKTKFELSASLTKYKKILIDGGIDVEFLAWKSQTPDKINYAEQL